jgi:G patch domain-containing protein 1
MAQKRSRAAYEADTSLVLYGTPLPPNDPDIRDDGSFVPLWKQEATDERGRKRFHGAFTGGFGAGYHNTVGSKEGWTPATFVSSRSNRANLKQRAEDFMDDEDLAEQEEAKKLATNDAFLGLGSTQDDAKRKDILVDLIQPSTSIGIRLLKKMGWKEGQGIGPKIRRQAANSDESHWFAPQNTKIISFSRKTDIKGLGYNGNTTQNEDEDDSAILTQSKARFTEPGAAKPKKSSFGVGVLNDTGSDDEDPYSVGPKISYNRSIGPAKKIKKPKRGGLVSSSKPSLITKPVFLSKKKIGSNLRKCHDGLLPLDGFVLALSPLNLSLAGDYAPPKIPEGWKSSKANAPENPSTTSMHQSTAEAARSSTLQPSSRADILGETPLPGKSVFDYLTSAAREKLATATKNQNLPAAGNEAPPEEYRRSATDKAKDLWSKIPRLDSVLAKSALSRLDFMPYADDPPKRARYRAFLESAASSEQSSMPNRADGHSLDEWAKEMREFAQAAAVFRPMTGMMASRFTSSTVETSGDFTPIVKVDDPAEAAAKMGMFGTLTRSVTTFIPTRLVCKRFGVAPPDESAADVGMEDPIQEPVSEAMMARMRIEVIGRGPSIPNREPGTWVDPEGEARNLAHPPTANVIDMDKNEALEVERPGDEVFKAIFGSDDEEDED